MLRLPTFGVTAEQLKDIPGAGVFDALTLLGYACWIAVGYGPISRLLSGELAWTSATQIGLAALLFLLTLFIVRAHQQRIGASIASQQLNTLAQACCVLVSCWAFHDGLQPALLVIVASQMTALFPVPWMTALLIGTNAVMTMLLFAHPIKEEPPKLQLAAMYWGLQLFAVMVWLSARRERFALQETQRINAELIATRHLLEEGARAEERLRLARELHDVAGHKLTALKLQLSLQARGAAAPTVDVEHLAGDVLTDIRGVVSTLRSHEGVDLQQALRALDPGLPNPRMWFELDPDLRVADMRRAQALLRCAQEGVTNALRHASATTLRVTLARGAGDVELTIEDDGRGRVAQVQPGNGLRGLRERVAELGGKLELTDCAPRGLRLRVTLPDAQAVAC